MKIIARCERIIACCEKIIARCEKIIACCEGIIARCEENMAEYVKENEGFEPK